MKTKLSGTSKRILLAILCAHLLLILLCYGAAIRDPDRAGLAPAFVAFVDFPISFAFLILASYLGIRPAGYLSGLAVDGSLSLVFGSLWWCFIVWFISGIFGSKGYSQPPQDNASNQSTDPTLASGTPLAEPESRHP